MSEINDFKFFHIFYWISIFRYYSGEKVAPIPTIFIGGNHEASNYLQELAYGGWVAPNIYYLGYANVINVNGIRIGGISGIFKGYNYKKGHFEFPPYDKDASRSVYHVRSLEVFRLKQLTPRIDIMISHDWPNRIADHGNVNQLLRFKPFFREDIESEKLGSPPSEELLYKLKPLHWFAAHLHVRFTALVKHSETEKTDFLALDKCLPNRKFLEVLDIGDDPGNSNGDVEFSYDLEWLTVLYLTNSLLNVTSQYTRLPLDRNQDSRTDFRPTQEEMDLVLKKFNNNLKIPTNFVKTVPAFNPQTDFNLMKRCHTFETQAEINPQTTEFCKKLGIDDPLFLALTFAGINTSQMTVQMSRAELESNSTSNEKSVPAAVEISLPPRAPLSSFLPKPKNDEEINIDSASDGEPEKTDETSQDGRLKRNLSQLQCDSAPKTSADDVNKTTTEPEEIPSDMAGPGKKFKRRNQTIYAETDD